MPTHRHRNTQTQAPLSLPVMAQRLAALGSAKGCHLKVTHDLNILRAPPSTLNQKKWGGGRCTIRVRQWKRAAKQGFTGKPSRHINEEGWGLHLQAKALVLSNTTTDLLWPVHNGHHFGLPLPRIR